MKGTHVAEAAANLGRLALGFHESGEDKKCDDVLALIRGLAKVTKRESSDNRVGVEARKQHAAWW